MIKLKVYFFKDNNSFGWSLYENDERVEASAEFIKGEKTGHEYHEGYEAEIPINIFKGEQCG